MKILRNRKAFTLVELIVVVSVIIILMAFIIPASQKVLINARKAKAQACMKQIAGTYCRYYQEKGYIPTAGTSVNLAKEFASEGELNNANLFVFPGDGKAAAVLRENIWPEDNTSPAWEPGKQLSVVLVGNITKAVDQATTPIAFSRGLQTDGKWSKDGVWGTDGGFIGFLDGQVRWYKNLSDDGGKLSTGTGSTSNIEAILTEDGNGTILSDVDTPALAEE